MTDSQLGVLADELSNDPENLGYVTYLIAGIDTEVANLLNNKNIPGLVPVLSTALLAWAGQNNRYRKLEVATLDVDSPIYSVAKVALMMIQRDGTSLDLSLSDRAAMLEALVATNVLEQSDSDSLYELAAGMVSRAEVLGLNYVSDLDIAKAKVLNVN